MGLVGSPRSDFIFFILHLWLFGLQTFADTYNNYDIMLGHIIIKGSSS